VKTKTFRHVNGPLSITFIRDYYWEGLKAERLKATSQKLKATSQGEPPAKLATSAGRKGKRKSFRLCALDLQLKRGL
jgi:hypothetical protein